MRKTCQNHSNPGLSQKSKVPKWVCRSTLAIFGGGQPFRAIFGPARGQIFGKKTENIVKNIKNTENVLRPKNAENIFKKAIVTLFLEWADTCVLASRIHFKRAERLQELGSLAPLIGRCRGNWLLQFQGACLKSNLFLQFF